MGPLEVRYLSTYYFKIIGGILQNTNFHMHDFVAHFKIFLEFELKLTLRCPTGPSQCLGLTWNLPTRLRESIRQRISMRMAANLRKPNPK